jgi:hypothetical protein
MGEHDVEYWFAKAEELEKQADMLDDIDQIVAQYNKKDEAMDAYSRGLVLSPTRLCELDRLIYLCRRARDIAKAEAALKRVALVRPKDEEILTTLMYNLRKQGKNEEAASVKVEIDALDSESDPEARDLNREIRHYDPGSDDLDPITRLMEEEFDDEEEPTSSSSAMKTKKPGIMDMFETDEDVEEIEGPLFDADFPIRNDEDDTSKEPEVDPVVVDAILNYGRVDEAQDEEKKERGENAEEDSSDLEDLFG